MRHVAFQRQQLVALGAQRLGLLVFLPALVNALAEGERPLEYSVEGRVARRNAAHAGFRVAVATGAGFGTRPGGFVPQGFTVFHPEHAGVR